MKPVLIVHGGAWAIPDKEVENHLSGMRNALNTGWNILKNSGSAMEAVKQAVVILEDDSAFDAGKGSVLNTDGSVEMDASIMCGRTGNAGAVAALRNFANPVLIAEKVLLHTDHLILAGEGAGAFARAQGFSPVPVESLLTEREMRRLEKISADKQFEIPHAFGKKRGTVGAAAIDAEGHIAAATSTGGTPGKIPGRIGDTALIGCGTWADDLTCGVSCTGWGEAIIKAGLARMVSAAVKTGMDAQKAGEYAIQSLASDIVDGLGGVIVVDFMGRTGMAYNTPRMARGLMKDGMNEPWVSV